MSAVSTPSPQGERPLSSAHKGKAPKCLILKYLFRLSTDSKSAQQKILNLAYSDYCFEFPKGPQTYCFGTQKLYILWLISLISYINKSSRKGGALLYWGVVKIIQAFLFKKNQVLIVLTLTIKTKQSDLVLIIQKPTSTWKRLTKTLSLQTPNWGKSIYFKKIFSTNCTQFTKTGEENS